MVAGATDINGVAQFPGRGVVRRHDGRAYQASRLGNVITERDKDMAAFRLKRAIGRAGVSLENPLLLDPGLAVVTALGCPQIAFIVRVRLAFGPRMLFVTQVKYSE